MRIDGHESPLIFRASLLAPHAAESQEESLLRSIAVDLLAHFSGFVGGNHLPQCHQSDARAAIVSGILSKCEPSIELQIVHSNEASVLISNATSPLFELFSVGCRPPVAQIALRIELAPLVVESVSQFVSDHNTNAAHVYGVIHLLIEKRRLKD